LIAREPATNHAHFRSGQPVTAEGHAHLAVIGWPDRKWAWFAGGSRPIKNLYRGMPVFTLLQCTNSHARLHKSEIDHMPSVDFISKLIQCTDAMHRAGVGE